jgi:hypothetical protein
MRKWLVGLLTLLVCIVAAVWMIEIVRNVLYDDREEKRQGRMIVDEIKTRDGSITAYWTPGRGRVTISVYAVTAEDKQDQVVEWVKALKIKGEIDRVITVNFYERENWIETPQNERGSGGGHRGPEKLIRTVQL